MKTEEEKREALERIMRLQKYGHFNPSPSLLPSSFKETHKNSSAISFLWERLTLMVRPSREETIIYSSIKTESKRFSLWWVYNFRMLLKEDILDALHRLRLRRAWKKEKRDTVD